MAWKDLEHFLVDHSTNAHIKDQFSKDPDALLSGYGLTADEIKLVKSGDQAAIKKYLGDQYMAALQVNVT